MRAAIFYLLVYYSEDDSDIRCVLSIVIYLSPQVFLLQLDYAQIDTNTGVQATSID